MMLGIVGNKVEMEPCEGDLGKASDSFKAKSFTCLNKIPNVFKKDDLDDLKRIPNTGGTQQRLKQN